MTTTLFPNAEAFTHALQDTATQGIDALLSMQKEMNAAALKGLAQLRAEQDRVTGLQIQAIQETLEANVQIAEKTLGWYREQVTRFATAPATPEA